MPQVRLSVTRVNLAQTAATFLMTLLAALLAGCGAAPAAPPPAAERASPNSAKPVGVPNPATVACIRAGGIASTERAPDGGERGLCRLPSGQVCDQWAFFRGECGSSQVDRRPGS
jgi:putative hemolysin